MTGDIAEQAMKDLQRTQAKIVSYRKGVANLEAQLPTFPWQKFRPDEVRAMLDALLRVTSDSLTWPSRLSDGHRSRGMRRGPPSPS
jgi:hypothetical protein